MEIFLQKLIVLLKELKVTMFNFDELKIIKGKESEERRCGSFVGIRRDRDTKEMHFILPRGFEDFDPNYDNVKYLFFNMYKTFKKFLDERNNVEKILDDKPQSKDNVSVKGIGSYRFTDSNDNEVIMYSKIEMIEGMIEVHKELDIETLIQQSGLVEEIDYSRIDSLINNGVFLKNHSILIDFMVGERNIIQGIPAEIIEIYCYIYNELLVELDYNINDRVKDIAYNFSYKNLTAEQGLFNEHTFESTITILKDRLDLVHRYTAYKDSSYWLIYDAVEKFLYSGLIFDNENEEGFWGINNFSQIWEDMCNTFFIDNLDKSEVIYCDSGLNFENKLNNIIRRNFGGFSILVDRSFDNNFYIKFNESKRWMRPDLVVKNNDISSFIELLFNEGVISYKVERNRNIFNNEYIIVSFSSKKLISYEASEQMKISAFNKFINKFEVMGFRNPRKISKKYNSLIVKKINSKVYHLNGISESIFLTEINNIFEDDRNRHSSPDIHCIDWKYLPLDYFEENSPELKLNITKQLTYDFCLHNNPYCENKSIQSQFGIPYYTCSDEYFQLHNDEDGSIQGIQICKMNFNKIQSVYLNA